MSASLTNDALEYPRLTNQESANGYRHSPAVNGLPYFGELLIEHTRGCNNVGLARPEQRTVYTLVRHTDEMTPGQQSLPRYCAHEP